MLNSSDTLIGGSSLGAGNVIAFNNSDGVRVSGGFPNTITNTVHGMLVRNRVRRNRIFLNTRLGIDLRPTSGLGFDPVSGVTSTVGSGGNRLARFPRLTSAIVSGGSTTVQGVLDTGIALATTYSLDFFSNQTCDPSGFGEGENYLGSIGVNTDTSGIVGFTANLPQTSPPGSFITATATDAEGNTSGVLPMHSCCSSRRHQRFDQGQQHSAPKNCRNSGRELKHYGTH